jgi:hypothetical protein
MTATDHGDYQTLIDACDWALSFFVHRDEMNAAVHASGKTKWSEATRYVALGLTVAGVRRHQITKVMYSWDPADPNLTDIERAAILRHLDEIR